MLCFYSAVDKANFSSLFSQIMNLIALFLLATHIFILPQAVKAMDFANEFDLNGVYFPTNLGSTVNNYLAQTEYKLNIDAKWKDNIKFTAKFKKPIISML